MTEEDWLAGEGVEALSQTERLLLMAAAFQGHGHDSDVQHANTARIVGQALLWAGYLDDTVRQAFDSDQPHPAIDDAYGALVRMTRQLQRTGPGRPPERPGEALFEGGGNWGVPGDPGRPPAGPHFNSCRLTGLGERIGRGLLERHPERLLDGDLRGSLLALAGRPLTWRTRRLALCAVVRSPAVWTLLASESQRAASTGEAFADGTVGGKELGAARRRADDAGRRQADGLPQAAAILSTYVCQEDDTLAGVGIEGFCATASQEGLCDLTGPVRDVRGHPRWTATLAPACLTPAILALAQAAYEERIMPNGHLDPARLGVLSDALEEAGCTDVLILSHLRSSGPHVRGCWVLDLVLHKE